jgi:alpha-beta hydrolase superfamily lysophospholipase
MLGRLSAVFAVCAAALGGQAIAAQAAFDPEAEARNFSKISERGTQEHGTPAYQALLAQQAIDDEVERAEIALNDPERDFSGNLCAQHKDGCAGDVRLYRWAESGYGLTYPVLYIARSGAIISGHVWMTRDGPPKRPGVVITTGSVQAPEELYLFAATTLAKKGYIVFTYDVQGQGRSDTYGEDPDRNEGYPAQQPYNFIAGTQDALNFLLSTPQSPYVPLPSDTSGTVHSARQDRRVAEGRNAAYNPAYRFLDTSRIGIIGHSLGASAVSQVCCTGPFSSAVDAVVAWDSLSVPSGITPRVPAIGMSADYGLVPTPFTAEPNPQQKNSASHAYSAAGIDTAQLNWRGGTHFEWSYIPNQGFGASWRGMDMAAWYTAAWLDKYVKGDPTADARLLTDRWRDDDLEQSIDPDNDGNMFSYHFRSRIDMDLSGGGHVRCENLRDLQGGPGENCEAASVSDGLPPDYSYMDEAQSPDPKGYARPRSAKPLTIALVPAFETCESADASHGAPLAAPSCSPPAPSSGNLTIGTPDANGLEVRSSGHISFKDVGESPINTGNGDQSDVEIKTSLTDVRRSSDLSDYTGELRAVLGLRITDRMNGDGTLTNEGGTATDVPLSFNVPCSATPGPEGGTCTLATTADAVLAGMVKEGQRAVWELKEVQLYDGGADGDADTAGDNELFAVPGLFAP